MGLSRQEVNLRRLLAKCELMLKNNQRDERFPKYVESLQVMLKEVEDSSDLDYEKRIHNIKLQLGMVQHEFNKRNSAIFDEEPSKLETSARDELLGVRKRNVASGDDLDEIINYHNDMQAKVAEDMLHLTKNLKEQSQLANKIIRKDTEAVGRSMQLSEQNFVKLKSESETLAEHSRRSCKCWMWLILLVVMIVFICMVLFMKVAKKRY